MRIVLVMTVVVIGSLIFNQQHGFCEEFVVKHHHGPIGTGPGAYELILLEAVLEKTVDQYGPYRIEKSKDISNPKRAEIELKEGSQVNINWLPVSQVTMSKELILVPIPLMKGILGYRIFLIHQQNQEKFARIKTLDELKQLRVGQGSGWGDVPIFEHNGFTVETGNDYEGLFSMLIAGRFDFFSRGIGEAPFEYHVRKDTLPDLWIEETILLYYPYPVYYFVNYQYPKLAERLERGLNLMIEDGSFDTLFFEYFGPILEEARVKGRKMFIIENPFLPPDTPLERKELWFDPTTDEKK